MAGETNAWLLLRCRCSALNFLWMIAEVSIARGISSTMVHSGDTKCFHIPPGGRVSVEFRSLVMAMGRVSVEP